MTDASGQFGCGRLWQNKWFQIEWKPEYRIEKRCQLQNSIMLRKLLPVIITGAIWGPQWRNSIKFYCNNEGGVAAINSGYSKIPGILHLLRCLFFIRVYYGIYIKATHTPGRENALANAISRDSLQSLFSQIPEARAGQTMVLRSLLEVLMKVQVNWSLVRWC